LKIFCLVENKNKNDRNFIVYDQIEEKKLIGGGAYDWTVSFVSDVKNDVVMHTIRKCKSIYFVCSHRFEDDGWFG
jgi:hypothetical protein